MAGGPPVEMVRAVDSPERGTEEAPASGGTRRIRWRSGALEPQAQLVSWFGTDDAARRLVRHSDLP
jgi:hypothetical protein